MLSIHLYLALGLSGAEPILALRTFMEWSGTILHHSPPNSIVTITPHILNYGTG